MKTAPKSYVALCCVFFTLNTVCGCLYLPQNTLPKVGDLPPLAKGSEKLLLTYSFSSGFISFDENDKINRIENKDLQNAQLESEFMGAFYESDYFSSIKTDGDWDIDIEMQFTLERDLGGVLLEQLSILTLCILPAYIPEQYHIIALVTAQNNMKYQYAINEQGIALVTWLPLMFVQSDCKNPYNTKIDIKTNMWKTLLMKMVQDGIIPTQAKTAANTAK